eukprot:jgi/Mesen1/538/ME001041S10744
MNAQQKEPKGSSADLDHTEKIEDAASSHQRPESSLQQMPACSLGEDASSMLAAATPHDPSFPSNESSHVGTTVLPPVELVDLEAVASTPGREQSSPIKRWPMDAAACDPQSEREEGTGLMQEGFVCLVLDQRQVMDCLPQAAPHPATLHMGEGNIENEKDETGKDLAMLSEDALLAQAPPPGRLEEGEHLQQLAAAMMKNPRAPQRKRQRRSSEAILSDESLLATLQSPALRQGLGLGPGPRVLRQSVRRASTGEAEEKGENKGGDQRASVKSAPGGRGGVKGGAGAGKKKQRAARQQQELDEEGQVAQAVGFHSQALIEEEIEAGVVATVGGLEQANYIAVRNHILAMWRKDVNSFLDLDKVAATVRSQHKKLVRSAYKFLSSHGYINFGVAPAIRAALPAAPTGATVVIVGAGLAGLAAARQLLASGHRVVVVEGRQRAGGRVYTKKMEGGRHLAAADLGGSVITGIDGNPLGVLARQLSIKLHKIEEACPLYQPDGSPVDDELDKKMELLYNQMLDEASRMREEMPGAVAESIRLGTTLDTLRPAASSPQEEQLWHWHLANLEYANAAHLSSLSLAHWDQDDPYEMGGDHCFLTGGNGRLIEALAEGLPISYGHTVEEIEYGDLGVRVTAVSASGRRVFEGDMALCTIPLGVLKKSTVKFSPPLPQRKVEAISRLGFGLLNK